MGSLTIVPGGEREQIECQVGEDAVFLRKRKGFVKLAVEHGVPLVPCFAFGEVDFYTTSNFLLGIRRKIASTLFVAIPIAWGDRWMPWLPRRNVPLTVVIGRPLWPPRGDDAVEQFHNTYMQALEELHEKHKTKYGDSAR